MYWGVWVRCHVYWNNFILTLIGRGFWMLLECGGGLNQPAPSRSPQNTVKNQNNFLCFSVMKSGTSNLSSTANREGLLDVAWVQGGGWISPHLLDHPKKLWKPIFFYWFPESLQWIRKSHEISITLFSWRNGGFKIVWADSAPPPPK